MPTCPLRAGAARSGSAATATADRRRASRRGRSAGPGVDPAKEAWHQAVQLDWGTPGKAIYVEGRLVAYATFAPGAFVPRTATLGPIVSDDAVLLVSLWVDPEHRGGGLGRSLVQAALREAALAR